MNDYHMWLALPFLLGMTTMHTGGGAGTGRDVDTHGDFVGRDQIINASQDEWRRYIDDRVRENHRLIMDTRRAIVYRDVLLAIIALTFVLVVIVSAGIAVRQFDQMSLQIERQIDRIERQLEMRAP